MKKYFLQFMTIGLLSNLAYAQEKDMEYYIKHAPFNMPSVSKPQFNTAVFSIADYGAVGDGKTLNSLAFKKAIDACSSAGGGIVEVPAGIWLTGPIEMKSNVNLHTEKNTLIQFTDDHSQYPIFKPKGSNSFSVLSPIYGNGLENIAITGDGIFDGAGESWRPVKKSKVSEGYWSKLIQTGVTSSDGKIWWPSNDAMNGEKYVNELKSKTDATAEDYVKARDFLRPYMVQFVRCKNILLEDVQLRNSPKFVFYPNFCENIIINHVNVFNEWWAQNGDGIDISACKNVVIYNSTVSAGDDAICMKSSNAKDSNNAQLQNILIAKCTVYRGHGGFVIGSNTDGGMKNIHVTDCSFNGTDIGIRIKSNEGRGGDVSQIFIDHVEMDNIINEAILITTFYGDNAVGKTANNNSVIRAKLPHYHDFHISNINCKKAETAIAITGLENLPAHDLFFENIQIEAKKGMSVTDAHDINFKHLQLTCPEPKYTLLRAQKVMVDQVDITQKK